MVLFFNECSLHGQFSDVKSFENALDELMKMRSVARTYAREMYCHRQFAQAMVTSRCSLLDAIGGIDKSKASALMSWISKAGPFWEDVRLHPAEEYLQCREEIVTDTSIGECAHLGFLSKEGQLASLAPSNWEASPLEVIRHKDDVTKECHKVLNHSTAQSLDAELQKNEPPPQSWDQLARTCPQKFKSLHFSKDSFSPLKGHPFVSAAAKSILDLLSVLDKFKATHKPNGGRDSDGDDIYQSYFTGDRAWFTDSSNSEKNNFKHEMEFEHPENVGCKIFAPFHGKVQTPVMRIHFSWPIVAQQPLYVLYVGEKITKR